MWNPFRRRDDGQPAETRAVTEVPWIAGGLSSTQVSVERAMGLVPVYSAIRLLASSVASLPLHCYRETGEETRERVQLPTLFAKPGVHGNRYAWKHRLVTSLATRGNGVGMVLQRDRDEYPSVLEWLNPADVHVEDGNMSGRGSFSLPIWYYQGREVSRENIVHIPLFTLPGRVWGLSPIEACSLAISSGLSAQEYTRDWFDNGAVPPGKFRNTEKTVGQLESEEIRDRLVNSIRKRKPLVFGSDWEYDPIVVSQHEAKFIDTLKLNATQVANIYGIPPEMIGGESGGSLTYNTVEQHGISFVTFTLRPWLELIEDAFYDLMPKPRYVKFNADALLRVDIQTRHNVYKVGREIGMYNIDELRALEDRPPLPNGKGQSYDPPAAPAAGQGGPGRPPTSPQETPPTDKEPSANGSRPNLTAVK